MISDKTADLIKIGGGTLLGAIAFGFCIYAASIGPQPILQILICVFGGQLGWVVGIVISPLSEGEKKQFSEYLKVIAAIFSGFLLAKLELLVTAQMAYVTTESGFIRTLLFLSCFLIGTLFTFIGRRYVGGTEAEHRAKRAKVAAELEDALRKLNALN